MVEQDGGFDLRMAQEAGFLRPHRFRWLRRSREFPLAGIAANGQTSAGNRTGDGVSLWIIAGDDPSANLVSHGGQCGSFRLSAQGAAAFLADVRNFRHTCRCWCLRAWV